MELKLNIYEKKKIIKTYSSDTYDIMFGTIEDLINIIDLDKLGSDNDIELINVAVELVMKSFDAIKWLLKDIFEGLTDEELRHTKTSEVASTLVEIVRFTIAQIGKGGNGKN